MNSLLEKRQIRIEDLVVLRLAVIVQILITRFRQLSLEIEIPPERVVIVESVGAVAKFNPVPSRPSHPVDAPILST